MHTLHSALFTDLPSFRTALKLESKKLKRQLTEVRTTVSFSYSSVWSSCIDVILAVWGDSLVWLVQVQRRSKEFSMMLQADPTMIPQARRQQASSVVRSIVIL